MTVSVQEMLFGQAAPVERRSAGFGGVAPTTPEIAGACTNQQSSDMLGKGRGSAALRRQASSSYEAGTKMV